MPRKRNERSETPQQEKAAPRIVVLAEFFFNDKRYLPGDTFEPPDGMNCIEQGARYCKFALSDKSVVLPVRFE